MGSCPDTDIDPRVTYKRGVYRREGLRKGRKGELLLFKQVVLVKESDTCANSFERKIV